MLTDYIEKIKSLLPSSHSLNISLLIVLVSVAFFGTLRLWLIWPIKTPVAIEQNAATGSWAFKTKVSANTENQKQTPQGKYVASKNGKSYHLPWCPGARSIKEENKIWFDSKEAAERAGYKPAGNCPGL